MVRVSRRAGFNGSALIRLLAGLNDLDVPESKQAFADRLSQWLRWTDAIELSAALDGSPALVPTGPPGARASDGAEEAECTRVRTALVNAIARDGAIARDSGFTAEKARAPSQAVPGSEPKDNTADFAPHRRRYVARQQAMEASIGPLRARLRAALARKSPAMARLAAMDAVMEQLLGPREHSLLSTVPTLLETHFERLCQACAHAHNDEQATPGDTQVPPDERGGWLDVFCQDMQGVLIAELDIRMQPVEGLLDALRSR